MQKSSAVIAYIYSFYFKYKNVMNLENFEFYLKHFQCGLSKENNDRI